MSKPDSTERTQTALTTDEYALIDDILQGALDLPKSERSEYIVQRCQRNNALFEHVSKLLAYEDDENAEPLSHSPVAQLARESARLEFIEGDLIGPYRIMKELGRGGHGVVYLANRADNQFDRLVAVKILKNAVNPNALTSFRKERQILADLNHQNIAELYDGGTIPDGRPYSAMEYVQGEPITHYCRRRGLSLRKRLRLFLKVCEAVRYAHEKWVVHRDLKPSNILVTDESEPKLLDFGIAKLLNPYTSNSLTLSLAEVVPMTPEYAAPEQVRGESGSEATDVYALGVILYELLTDRRPYYFSRRSLFVIQKTVLEKTPLNPSKAVLKRAEDGHSGNMPVLDEDLDMEEIRRRHRSLAGDLDFITMRALEKDPGRRYVSVAALADDIRRHLDNLPISAGDGNPIYKIRKFIIRQRWAVVGIAAILLLPFSFVLAELIERNNVNRATRDTNQTAALLMEIMRIKPEEITQNRRLQLKARVDRQVRIAEETKVPNHVAADCWSVLGEDYLRLGFPEAAVPLLQRSLDFAQKCDTWPNLRDAHTLYQMGLALHRLGDLDHAERFLARSYAIRKEKLGSDDKATLETQYQLSRVRDDLSKAKLYR